MSHDLTEITPTQISDNPFKLIGKDWMLIAAGGLDAFNMMTASWGAVGELWNRRVAICFIRPQRYTFGFMERSAIYTLNFFDELWRPALDFCGSRSGREVNKAAETGLTPLAGEGGAVYFAQARLVLECRKLYAQDIDPARFVDPTIPPQTYPTHDYHRMYVGEIVRCLSAAQRA
jgi:flavin reductase (DIM6/NTAB) family NADH-FMN oxidoreductase RutF